MGLYRSCIKTDTFGPRRRGSGRAGCRAALAIWPMVVLLTGSCCHSRADSPPPPFDTSLVPAFASAEVAEAVARADGQALQAGRSLAVLRRDLLARYTEALLESFEVYRVAVPEVSGSLAVDIEPARAALGRAETRRRALLAGAPLLALRWLPALRLADTYLGALSEAIAAVEQQEPARARVAFLARYQALAEHYNRWAEVAAAATAELNDALEASVLPRSSSERRTVVWGALGGDWVATWPERCEQVLGAGEPRSDAGRHLDLALTLGFFTADDAQSSLSRACRQALRPVVDALVACRAHGSGERGAGGLSEADVASLLEQAVQRFVEARGEVCP